MSRLSNFEFDLFQKFNKAKSSTNRSNEWIQTPQRNVMSQSKELENKKQKTK